MSDVTEAVTLDYNKAVDFKRLKFIQKGIEDNGNSQELKILDVGCGNGNISRFLGSKGFNVLGIDVSKEAIEVAQAKNTFEHVQFLHLSAEDLVDQKVIPKFDVVVCSEVLEHLQDPGALLQKIHEVLRDAGVLIVTVPNGYGPREVLVTKPIQRIYKNPESFLSKFVFALKRLLGYSGKTNQSEAEDLSHIQFFTIKQLMRLSSENGFKIVKKENSDFLADTFPISLATRRSLMLQKLDCKIADIIPMFMASGFHTLWIKDQSSGS